MSEEQSTNVRYRYEDKKTWLRWGLKKRESQETETSNGALLPYRMFWEKKISINRISVFQGCESACFPCGFWSRILYQCGIGSGSRAVKTKNCNFVIPRTLKRTSKLQAKPSALKKEHPVLQNKKFLHIALFLWIIFARLDPDPAEQNQCGSGSWSTRNPTLVYLIFSQII